MVASSSIADPLAMLADLQQGQQWSMGPQVADPAMMQSQGIWQTVPTTFTASTSNVGTVPVIYSQKSPATSYTASTVISK